MNFVLPQLNINHYTTAHSRIQRYNLLLEIEKDIYPSVRILSNNIDRDVCLIDGIVLYRIREIKEQNCLNLN